MTNLPELVLQAQQHAAAKRFEVAENLYRRIVQQHPQATVAWHQYGNLLKAQKRFAEAERCYRYVLQQEPRHAEANKNLGIALANQNQIEAAIEYYLKAIQIKPDYFEAFNNLGNARRDQARYPEALQAYHQALAINPQHADVRANFAQMLLLLGDWEQGWQENEFRWQQASLATSRPTFVQPQWNGESLQGKALLLYAEQGLGDTLQFIRYALPVKRLGARVILSCPTPLKQLLQNQTGIGIDEWVFKGEILPAFDYYIPLLSLPRVFHTKVDTVPAFPAYLNANAQLVAQWQQRLQSLPGVRIGINWHGRTGVGRFQNRDIPLDQFASLANLPNISLVSLQKGETDLAARTAIWKTLLVDFGDEVDQAHGPFMDTAAIMKNLDLVITSDTSIAHLAGALGVPVWVALPFSADWRWLLNRDDSPWYPTMRLFRQTKRGEWGDVFGRIKQALMQAMA